MSWNQWMILDVWLWTYFQTGCLEVCWLEKNILSLILKNTRSRSQWTETRRAASVSCKWGFKNQWKHFEKELISDAPWPTYGASNRFDGHPWSRSFGSQQEQFSTITHVKFSKMYGGGGKVWFVLLTHFPAHQLSQFDKPGIEIVWVFAESPHPNRECLSNRNYTEGFVFGFLRSEKVEGDRSNKKGIDKKKKEGYQPTKGEAVFFNCRSTGWVSPWE